METDHGPLPGRVMTSTLNPERESWVRDAVAHFEGPLTLYAARLLRDAETARDVVQETFLKLCASDQDSIDGHLAEWLFTVCRNRALDVLRKEHRMTQLRDEQVLRCLHPDPGPLDLAERHELGTRVLELLEALPPSQREVIRLKFQNGFSYQEISRISGHSVSNVGYLIHAGIKALRGHLFVGQPAEGRFDREENLS
jgi:RNA polymerase sigma factor (sigma-70 family)